MPHLYSTLGVREYATLLKNATRCQIVETKDEIGTTYCIFDMHGHQCGQPYTDWNTLVEDTVDAVMGMLTSNRDYIIDHSH